MIRTTRRSIALLVVLLAAGAGAFAEEPAENDGPSATTGPTVTDGSSLFRSTLVQDISTAGFYELIGWLETLGLSTRGDRSTLADRLYDYYEVSEEELESGATREQPGAGPPLVIDSASRTNYFTLEAIDERYVRLSGGVLITLRDEEQSSVHRIQADEVTFNEEQRTLAASGSVVYTLERGGTTERFTGEALTVELDSWEGAFVRGVTERARTIEGEEIDFSFTGTYITRSRDDVIVLEDGRITSSSAVPPNYEIRAHKIWVLAPGEWGLRNAYLYVGRVPLFYLPFFFRPGNELFFNPAIGTRDRSGTYIQTTTYLAGTPEEQTSAFSLLQLAEDQGPQSEREIDGLFLVPSDASDQAPSAPSSTVRLLGDIYTKLGALVALDAELPELGPLRQVDFYLGLAASRHIYVTSYPGAGVAYTPYFISEGEATQSWNSSAIGSLTFPFRHGIELSARTGSNRLTANLRFQSYSDQRFATDFNERSEQIDWLGLLGQGTPTSTPGSISSLLWQLDATYRADTSAFPRISQLSVQRAVIALNWRSRQIDDSLLPDEVRLADNSPESAFFYPNSLRLPEISASVSGTLFEFPLVRPTEAEPRTLPQLVPPWVDTQDSGPDDSEAEPTVVLPLILPPVQPALPSPRVPAPFSGRIGYSVAPTLIVDQIYLDRGWEQPADVDFGIAYAGASVRLVGSLGYSGAISSDLLRIDGSLGTTTQYRDVYNRNPDSELLTDAEWETLRRQAWGFTSFAATNNLTVRTQPLRSSRLWAQSSLSYTANLLLYQIVLDQVVSGEPEWKREHIEWDERFFRQHQVQATASLAVLDTQSLQLTAALPPRDERYSGSLTLRAHPASLTVGAGVGRPDETWIYDPITANAALRPADRLSLVNVLSYDVEAEELTFNRTNLVLGPTTSEFELRTTEGFEFESEGPEVGWQPDGDVRLRPSSARFELALSSDLDPFWRNRVMAQVSSELSWQSSLIRFTESSLRFSFRGGIVVNRFLRLSLESTSVNSQSYVYIRPLARAVGREPRNVLVDLARSFNVFDRDERIQSGFNIQTISLNAIHDLGDWDLTIRYSGRPQLETAEDQTRSYQWRARLDLSLQWRPIKELSTSIRIDDDQIGFGADS